MQATAASGPAQSLGFRSPLPTAGRTVRGPTPLCAGGRPYASLTRRLRNGGGRMPAKVNKTDEEWRRELTPEQYEILRRKGTERPWSNEYNDEKSSGTYRCAGCGAELFASDAKFESGTGWPSFYQPAGEEAVETERDGTLG